MLFLGMVPYEKSFKPVAILPQPLDFCGNNWLSTPTVGSTAEVLNEIDISGTTLTIEATFNRTAPYDNGILYAGDLVSKHYDTIDCNYLLRPNEAEIVTTNGYFRTPDICEIELNKTYHVAMVYDGSTLKFYRNGYLMSQVAASGNLKLNDLKTRIGWYEPQDFNTNLIGYINEVRIWNIARTQAQLQATMNSTLPNPTTQTGLLAYYSFTDLQNKQGNSNYDLRLLGSASISANNPACNFIADSCGILNNCNSNWLSTPTLGSTAEVLNEIDIPGNTLTVEATFNRTTPYSNGFLYAGDIVSKHFDPNDCNYLLRPNEAEITTSNGYFRTPPICEIQLNKTYHVAMVYDGSSLKFYRNGFLMSQINASGILKQNNWKTRIGWYEPQMFNTNLIGYINEVRIWNVARTQAQLRSYMNASLPNPTSQTGLLAYYTFDNLLNKQGNSNYNLTLLGSASINASNPACNFIADSCNITTPVRLTSFLATVRQGITVHVNWETADELNIAGYDVERAEEGSMQFSSIATINSNSNARSNSYQWLDRNVLPGHRYLYRLKIKENDGTHRYSAQQFVQIPESRPLYTFAPNPTRGIVTLYWKTSENAELILLSSHGALLKHWNHNGQQSSESIDLSAYPAGMYLLEIHCNNKTHTEKIIKN